MAEENALPVIDPKATTILSSELLGAVKSHFIGRPIDRMRVFEVLNALAFASAQVIKGTGDPDGAIHAWFLDALSKNLK